MRESGHSKGLGILSGAPQRRAISARGQSGTRITLGSGKLLGQTPLRRGSPAHKIIACIGVDRSDTAISLKLCYGHIECDGDFSSIESALHLAFGKPEVAENTSIAVAYISGKSLRARLRRNKVPPAPQPIQRKVLSHGNAKRKLKDHQRADK